jgi:hypothetical protein
MHVDACWALLVIPIIIKILNAQLIYAVSQYSLDKLVDPPQAFKQDLIKTSLFYIWPLETKMQYVSMLVFAI